MLQCRPLLELADHFFTAGDLELRADDREWTAVAEWMGLSVDRLFLIRQVHRTDVAVVRRGRTGRWVLGARGARSSERIRSHTLVSGRS